LWSANISGLFVSKPHFWQTDRFPSWLDADMAKQLVSIEYPTSCKNMPPRKAEPFRKNNPSRYPSLNLQQ
jgi:hypothetical protein